MTIKLRYKVAAYIGGKTWCFSDGLARDPRPYPAGRAEAPAPPPRRAGAQTRTPLATQRAFRLPAASRPPLPRARALPPNTLAPSGGTAPYPLPPSAPEARRAVRKVALNSAALCQGTSSRSEGWEAAILTQGQPWGSNHLSCLAPARFPRDRRLAGLAGRGVLQVQGGVY